MINASSDEAFLLLCLENAWDFWSMLALCK
jgi:hypothetical protein